MQPQTFQRVNIKMTKGIPCVGSLLSGVSGGQQPRGGATTCWTARARESGGGAGTPPAATRRPRCTDGFGGPGSRGEGAARPPGPLPTRGPLQPLSNVCEGRRVRFLVSGRSGGRARPPLPPPRPAPAPAPRPGARDPRDRLPRLRAPARPPARNPRAGAARAARAPEVASPCFRPAGRGAGPVTGTRSSKNAPRGASEARAQLRPSAGGAASPLPRSTADRAGCAHLLANQTPQGPGLRKPQPFQTRGKWRRKAPVTSRGGESSPPGANERLRESVSARAPANPGRRRRTPPPLFRIRGPRRCRHPMRARRGRAPGLAGQ